MKKKKDDKYSLYVCPKCMEYECKRDGGCSFCGYKKSLKSVLGVAPNGVDNIPYEDLYRIVEYRKTNGYSYADLSILLKKSKKLGVKMPRDSKPLYALKKATNVRSCLKSHLYYRAYHLSMC